MKKEEFQQLLQTQFRVITTLTATKGEEYSRSDDQLANFKRLAADLELDPKQVWMVYFTKHIDSIKGYIAGRVCTEGIFSRIDDAILYLCLLRALVHEDMVGMVVEKLDEER